MGKIKDLTGQRFGRLVAVELLEEKTKQGACIWLCVCDCGKIIRVRSNNLSSATTQSCGCFKKEVSSKRFTIFHSIRRKEAKERLSTGKKKCSDCEEVKNLCCFSKNKKYLDGHDSFCKTCSRKQDRKYLMSEKGAVTVAKRILKRTTPSDIELPQELIEARAELIKIRRKIKELTQ